nr:hypothetical protein Iba_chr05aCG1850 [Ipomoea batatas]
MIALSECPPTFIIAFCISVTTISGLSGIPCSKTAFIMQELYTFIQNASFC